MSVRSSQDSVAFSTPGAAAQATASLAAPGSTQRWIATAISATLAAGATAQAAQIFLNLRNGASGAGSIIWSKSVILPVNGLWEVDLSELNIPGAYGAAMTLEFSGAGAAGTFASVALTGYLSA